MREDIIYPPAADNMPFNVEMTGISYCDETYYILREHSVLTCIEYVISGEGTVNFNARTVYPQQGDMYILPRGNRHEYYSDAENPWTKIWINLKGSLAEYLLSAYGLNNKTVIRNCDGSKYIYEIQKICSDDSLSPYETQSRCAEVFFSLIQFIARHNNDDKFSEALMLKEYIDKNAVKELTLEQMADLISHSVSQTIRIFKKEYGVTPYEYMLAKRIELAKLMLKNTNLRVKDISVQTGFNDEHYFSLLFRKRTGHTPLQYRSNPKT